MISSGTHAEAARFLTGSPAQEFVSNDQSPEELWANILDAFENEYLITAASFNEWNGLIAGHGYIVKDHLMIKGQDG